MQNSQPTPFGQQSSSMMQTQQIAVQSTPSGNLGGKANAQCDNYSRYGHYYWECPSAPQTSQRGVRRGRCQCTTKDNAGDEEEDAMGTARSPRNDNACCSDHVRIRCDCTGDTIGVDHSLSVRSQSVNNGTRKLVESFCG